MKILLLEDDYNYRNSIKDLLENLQYCVDDFENGKDVLEAIDQTTYDLLLLDIRVPEIDGYTIAKKVRTSNIQVPIIFITSLTEINNLSLGYELGCNDYIRKPFSLHELKWRVEQTIRSYHFKSFSNSIYLSFDYIFDIFEKTLYQSSQEVILTEIEKKIIFILVKNSGRFIATDALRDIVWEDRNVCDSDVRMAIKKIRDKTHKDFITSVRGIGYKIEKK